MRIHFLVHGHRADAVEAAAKAVEFLRSREVMVAAEMDTADRLHVERVADDQFAEADLVITFGGDGTLIRAADLCSQKGTPILGVYYGRFGFVTQCQGHELGACLSSFFDGTAAIEKRMMLHTELLRGGNVIASLHSLNEMVLQRMITSTMMTFQVTVDSHLLTSYPADGILISTPTGSTAYNLSAGGPILDPSLEAMILTAISPHTLSARPLVLNPDSVIELKLQAKGDAVLSTDGRNRLHLLSDDVVRVTRSPRVTNLICVERNDFLVKLSERLLWSYSHFNQTLNE